MKLGHLLIVTLLAGILGGLAAPGLEMIGLDPETSAARLLLFPAIAFITVVLAWPIARCFRMTPLMIFSGPCPNCKQQPPGWGGHAAEPDRLLLLCVKCGTEFDLWLTCRPPMERVTTTRPACRLRWPEFLGVWKRIETKG
jgi:hypothetical protein